MRYIGLDVHREFCEVAISRRERSARLGGSGPAGRSWSCLRRALAQTTRSRSRRRAARRRSPRILRAQVARVVVVNTKKLRAISEAKAKTDRLDARRLAELLAAGYLAEVWCPDERTRALRRYVARRAQLVRQRSRAKNEIAAALQRNLLDRPGVYDVAGERGRRFLEGVELPADERQTVAGCLRQIDFLDREIAEVDRALAEAAVGSPEIRRLMTVPGVNLHTAATFMARVGEIGRFRDPRKLVSYLGLDPRVRQSGEEPVRYGHISKEGASEARHMLCEAAWIVVRYPSPLSAFSERIKARRGSRIATVAVARKLVVLFWHLLTKEEDYAFGRPTLTSASCAGSSCSPARSAGARAGAPRRAPPRARRRKRPRSSSPARRRSPTGGSSPTGSRLRRRARARHGDAHLQSRQAASSAARHQSQTLRFSSSSPAPTGTLARSGQRVQRKLDFHPSPKATRPRVRAGLAGLR